MSYRKCSGKKYVLLISLIVLFPAKLLYAQDTDIVFPDDANVYNVQDYGAMPDDGLDDLPSILSAMDAAGNADHIVYFPDGVYDVSGTIKISPTDQSSSNCGSCHKRVIIQGQSRESTIIRLQDNCPGYQDSDNRKGVIWTGTAPAQRFRNAIRNLTVNTGSGNPGAAGIQFVCNNQGTMRHVGIVSEDGQGAAGLDLSFTGEIGPGFIKDLYVKGFNYGILNAAFNSMTFEQVCVDSQLIAGIYVTPGVVAAMRNVNSNNSVQAILNKGILTLLDSELTGGSSGVNAINNESVVFARNLMTSGYDLAIMNNAGHGTDASGPYVSEYTSDVINSMFSSTGRSLNLPIKDVPEIAWGDPAEWVNVQDFGAVPDDVTDCTQAFQDAIDQPGAKTVYLPAVFGGNANYRFDGEVFIRGSVERIIGCEAKIRGSGKFILDNGEAPAVIIERLDGIYNYASIEHRADRALIVSSITGIDVIGNGTGDLFIEDWVSHLTLNRPGQHLWGWQINTEQKDVTNIINNGAIAWILGLKTEQTQTKIHTFNGGAIELMGAWIYAQQKQVTEYPLFKVEDSQASFSGVKMVGFMYPFTELVVEKRAHTERVWDWDAKPGYAKTWGLYSGVDSDFVAPYPDPMQFHDLPEAAGCHSISMEAIIAVDSGDVEYFFECVSGPGHSSGWQDSHRYTDVGIPVNSTCSYRVRSRDISLATNLTKWSEVETATTQSGECLTAVTLSVSDTVINEGSGERIKLIVTRDNHIGEMTVFYLTGGNCSNIDFREALSGRITIQDGVTEVLLTFTPIDDLVKEPDREFSISLLPGPGYEPDDPHSVRIVLEDNDTSTSGLPMVNIKAVQPWASEQGRKPGIFEISRNTTEGSMVISLEQGGTASVFDFTLLLPEDILFSDGDSVVILPLAPFLDSQAEGQEVLILKLLPSSAYTIAEPAMDSIYITDFDGCEVTLEVTDSLAVEEGMRPARITLHRTGPLVDDLDVYYILSGSAGTEDIHDQLTGFFTIPMGSSSIEVSLTPEPDEIFEGEESLVITLQAREFFYDTGDQASGQVTVVDTSTFVDTRHHQTIHNIRIYPNPNSGQFILSGLNPEWESTVILMNSNGSIIMVIQHVTEPELRISMDHMEPGIYVIRIVIADKVSVKKVILY